MHPSAWQVFCVCVLSCGSAFAVQQWDGTESVKSLAASVLKVQENKSTTEGSPLYRVPKITPKPYVVASAIRAVSHPTVNRVFTQPRVPERISGRAFARATEKAKGKQRNIAVVHNYAPLQAEPTPRIERFTEFSVSSDLVDWLESRPDIVHFGSLDTSVLREKDTRVYDPRLRKQGIHELLAVGVSDYAGSTRGREHNVQHSLAQYHGRVIEQGKTFSFNEILGPVNYQTGYKDAMIIKEGKAVAGIGGGVCQTSTTVYRAALMAGMPIVSRRNHTFGVAYYGPKQGLDATIYPGVQDLIFQNDTPGDLLMVTARRGTKVFVLLYGTKDREVQTSLVSHWGNIYNGLQAQWQRVTTKLGQAPTDERVWSTYRAPE